jgi:DNA-binding GntR family transcriptional regulator
MSGVIHGFGSSQRDSLLLKDNLAAHFREEIISGRLLPGEKIVEVSWAKLLGISQTSVREALNILSAEGFVQKGSGRTAQVTKLSDQDVLHSYELRSVLEGYVARVLTQRQPDLSELDQSIADMRSAINCNNVKAFYERDLQFHLLLAEKTDNPMLVQAIKRIILPLFAFVVIRVHGARTRKQQWLQSLDKHQRIIDAIRTRDAAFAEHLVMQTISAFLNETEAVIQPVNTTSARTK